MKKFVSVVWRRPRSGARKPDEETDLLFDEGGVGLESEPVPALSSPRWGRSMALPVAVLFCVLAMVYLQQRAQGQRAAAVGVKERLAVERARAVRVDDVVQRALSGEPSAVNALRRLRGELAAGVSDLKTAAAKQGPTDFPVLPLSSLESRWRALQNALGEVIERAAVVEKVHDMARTVVPQLESAEGQASELFVAVVQADALASDTAAAGRLATRLARMTADAALLGRGSDPGGQHSRGLAVELDAFVSDLGRLSGVNGRLAPGANSADALGGLVARLGTQAPVFVERTRELLSAAPALSAAREVRAATALAADSLVSAIDVLDDAHRKAAASGPNFPGLFGAVSALTVILVAMFALQVVRVLRAHRREARVREGEIRERNRRNQDAILQLLDEISDLADGDLTNHTTVTEEITGAVADAVNYAIDALRELVSSINRTSEAVAKSAHTTRGRTLRLSLAADKQTAQIARASGSVQAMADTGRAVSDNAVGSSEVARQSVDVAARGARAVRETISGMEQIREGIQGTAKRLKRLGESSQEIGNIVGLIDDIADQTNVLALNAAIQASMAGEAGRGFGVVADEVQRLAERARQATKRIEALVSTIQEDTSEAIASMEQSTVGVVAGAHLARDAGGALQEIEQVSNVLAQRIHGISESATMQAARAEALATSMQALEAFAVQVRSGTNVTASTANRLSELAQVLERSVSRFRLPPIDHENVVDLMPGVSAATGAESSGSSEQSRERGRS